MAWLPVMLRLDGLRCVVVGGGAVAERKVCALLEAKADSATGPIVTVVSPVVTDTLAAWASQGRISWEAREYRAGDAAGAAIVFATADKRDVNERAAAEARACGALVNIADDPERSGVLLPSVARRGKLTLAVSTAGASPSAARRIRRELEQRYGPEYATWLDWLAEARLLLRGRIAGTERRQELHRELERLDGPELLRRGLLPDGWQEEWLAALERDPTIDAVRRLAQRR